MRKKNMKTSLKPILAGLALTGLVACVEDSGSGSQSATPSLAEQGCLRDVTQVTNNPEVALLSSSFSQAGTEVIVGVGPDRAPWRCIGYSDGTTADISSLTNEGTL
ncbi:hypothetical protein [Sulfitobacter sp. TBRI5]